MPHVEVLAPAGSPESFEAALQAGADAVYLGLREFNARGNAINFTSEELAFHVPRAHAVGTSVYLTLNTIVKTAEMRSLMKSLDLAVSAGIDGVIFQDLGLGDLILRYYPHLRRHASTQLAVHNLDGVQFCVDRGIQRVVLARELTIEEIRDIRDRFPSNVIELEVFCHGAMCYTYSGLCFFSGSVGGRSGNRGECAYTCRKGYRIHNERHFPKEAEKGSYLNYLFSMKDMMTLELVEPLVESGVDSLKIEGRRKGPAYVHAAVSAYRQRLAGKDTDLENDLKLAFARQPTKAFYLRGQFGDAPVDTFSPGTQGVYLGTIGADGWFTLETSGLQRYDGLRLVYPNRQEHLRSFKNYRVSSGDSMRPGKGVRVKLAENHPHGTLVMWTHSQDVSQKYSVDQPMIRGVAPIFGTVDTRATIEKDQLTIEMKSNRACVRTVLPLEPSENTLSLEDVLHRFGDSPFRSGTFEGPVGFGFVPMKIVKEVRRKMLAELATKHQEAIEVHLDEVTFERKPFKTQTHPSYIVRVDQLDLAQALLPEALSRNWSLDIVLRSTWSTPAWRSAWAVLRDSKVPLRWVLPPVMRKWDVRVLNQRIKSFGDLEMDWVVSNPGHLAMLKRWGVKLTDEDAVRHAISERIYREILLIDLDESSDWTEVAELLDASFRLTAGKRLIAELDARD